MNYLIHQHQHLAARVFSLVHCCFTIYLQSCRTIKKPTVLPQWVFDLFNSQLAYARRELERVANTNVHDFRRTMSGTVCCVVCVGITVFVAAINI